MTFKKALLQKQHNRDLFDCGVSSLNHYIKKQAGQDVRKKLSVCFVFTEQNDVKGYYTLSGNSIPLEDVPEKYLHKIPKSYTNVPVILLGRLAIDKSFHGKGFGEYLLIDALKECWTVAKEKIGAMAVIVDTVNENAEKFYQKYGFIKLEKSGKMFIPMNTINKLFE